VIFLVFCKGGADCNCSDVVAATVTAFHRSLRSGYSRCQSIITMGRSLCVGIKMRTTRSMRIAYADHRLFVVLWLLLSTTQLPQRHAKFFDRAFLSRRIALSEGIPLNRPGKSVIAPLFPSLSSAAATNNHHRMIGQKRYLYTFCPDAIYVES